MHKAIENLLKSRGINSVEELDAEEKKQFDAWQKVLSKDKVSVSNFIGFLNIQKSLIEAQFGDITNSHEKNSRLVLQHAIYTKLIKFFESDKRERELLQEYLTSLIDV